MFNLAIDSKLRGCDVVALKVEDVAPWREKLAARKSCPQHLSKQNSSAVPSSYASCHFLTRAVQ
jgi:hypothetical protein